MGKPASKTTEKPVAKPVAMAEAVARAAADTVSASVVASTVIAPLGGVDSGVATDAAGASRAGEALPKPDAASVASAAFVAASDVEVYTVISPLAYDQKLYAVGDPVTLTAKQAAPLLGHTVAAGVVDAAVAVS